MNHSIQIFNIYPGDLRGFIRLPIKLKQVELNLGSTELLMIKDPYEAKQRSFLSIYEFDKLLSLPKPVGEDGWTQDKIVPKIEFPVVADIDGEATSLVVTKALWYIDN